MKGKKKLISMLLMVAMILSLIPMSVYAATYVSKEEYLPNDGYCYIVAVSYTHLDVYKRQGLGNSIWAMVLLALLGEFFWFFGIHGSNVTSAANNTLFMPGAIENASNVAAGLPATNAVNSYFLEAFKGPRHCVLSAMLAFMSKSKQLKAVGKIAVRCV